jgi:chaperonin GroES
MNIEKLQASLNIAALLPEDQVRSIGQRCLEDYQRDLRSRAPWETKMVNAMKIAVQLAEKKNTPWQGASNVKFPMLSIACVQFQSRVFPQLFSTPRPVKMRVIGKDKDSAKHDRAARISEHMSYQCLEEDTNWLSEHDTLVITLPIMGSGFIKSYYDGITKSIHVHAKDLVVNYYAKSLETCSCYTHRIPKYKNEIIEKQRKKIYLDIDIHDAQNQKSKFDQLEDDFQGKIEPGDYADAPINLYEQYRYLDLDGDDYKEPYTVTFDDEGRVYRIINRFANIERDGNTILKIEPKHYFTKYTFIPSPDGGFYDMGFGSLLTPINESVNTIINQLIDAGTLATRQGGFVGRGARLKGGALKFKMGEYVKIDATGDDIRKNIFQLPVREPSGVLFTLLTYLVEYGERLSSVSDMMVGKTPGQNTPATTAMAALEEGMKVITAIYQRIYRALKVEFQKRYLLNQEYLNPEEYYLLEDDQKAIFQQDYNGDPTDIRPSADPNMSSDVQRLARLDAITQRAHSTGGYNMPALEKRFLEQMNVEGIDEIYPTDEKGNPTIQPPPDPKTEIESAKFQAEQLYRSKELQIKAALADSTIAIQETQALLNLAKAEAMGNKNEIEGYKVLLMQIKENREAIKDGINEGGLPTMENGPGNKNIPPLPEGVQPGASGP